MSSVQELLLDTKNRRDDNDIRAWGFTVNVTYTNLDSLWNAVYNTKIHLVDRNDVEFVLVAKVKSYSAHVFSVWIYLAAIFDTQLSTDQYY